MKKIKFNLLAIIGMMVAVATVAFTVPHEVKVDQLFWYEKDQITEEYSPVPTNSPPANCEENSSKPICALGFTEEQSQVDDSMLPLAEAHVNRRN